VAEGLHNVQDFFGAVIFHRAKEMSQRVESDS
jgi:hypothetical protein